MFKRTHIKLISLLIVLSLVLTSIPGSAVNANAVNAEAAESSTFQLDADCQILDYVHEEVFNGNDHIARLKEEETLDTYVFLNRDGTKTVYYMNDAVKYRDASGTIREKNIDLTTGINGYSTTQNDVQLHIPNNISNGVQLSYAGYDVSIVPQGGSSKLSPQRNGNSVAYPNYFGSGTALVYTPTLDGVKEDILLAKYSGTSEFTFLLNTDGLNLYHTPEDRYYLALAEDSQMQIWLGNIEIFDAEAKPSMGNLTVETVTAGQQYRLTVSADVEFLTDPDTVYPVTIDPTITVSDNNNGVNAIEDAPIFEGYPTSNFGTYQYDRAGYVGSPYGKGRTVVRLNGLLTDTNYNAASEYNISSVIFYIAEASGTAAQQVNLYPLTSNSTWTETNITWNNFGSFGFCHATTELSYNGYAAFNITALARKWKNNTEDGDCGFILMSSNESTVDKALYSCEHSTSSMRPYVVATYNSNLNSVYNPGPYLNKTYDLEDALPYHVYIGDDALQLRANCYGYAVRLFYSGTISEGNYRVDTINGLTCHFVNGNGISDDVLCYKQQPGEFVQKPLTLTNSGYSVTFTSNADLKTKRDELYSDGANDEIVIDFMAKLVKA
ncbi:MAG: DNRLRE domain-containing protein, partial [Oscillospiraceae bacterium]|nr:DNRLRE domain-containing protein [Oscillospiraceae bacterium]